MRAHVDCGIDEYGLITLKSKGSSLHSSLPPTPLLYNKHGVIPWYDTKENLVRHKNGHTQAWINRERTQTQLMKRSLLPTRKALIRQTVLMKKMMYQQTLTSRKIRMTKTTNMCLRKRILPMGGILGPRFSACWNSKICSFLLHPIFRVRNVPFLH